MGVLGVLVLYMVRANWKYGSIRGKGKSGQVREQV